MNMWFSYTVSVKNCLLNQENKQIFVFFIITSYTKRHVMIDMVLEVPSFASSDEHWQVLEKCYNLYNTIHQFCTEDVYKKFIFLSLKFCSHTVGQAG